MSREQTIPIEDYTDMVPGRAYRLRVCALNRPRKQPFLLAIFKHVDPEQQCRPVEAQLPFPCRPSGLTAQFIASCGHEILIGTSVRVKDCIGTIVLARFARAQSGDLEISSFDSIIPEALYAAPESAQPDSVTTPAPQTDPDGGHCR